jgi:hypothetical protein
MTARAIPTDECRREEEREGERAEWQRAIRAAAERIRDRADDEFRADCAAALASVAGETLCDGAALYGRLYQI